MINGARLACAFTLVLMPLSVGAQDALRYREFQLGADVASVVTLTGAPSSEVKVIHERPAKLQDLEWRPRYFSRGPSTQTDPVDRMVFSFYNDQLYRIVVDYDPHRTEGMTEADIVASISTTYGVPVKPAARTSVPPVQYGDADALLATWGTIESALALYRTSYPVKYRLVVGSTRLAGLAELSAAEAVRLDARDAPQRELEQRQKEAADARAAEEDAKKVNLPGFRP